MFKIKTRADGTYMRNNHNHVLVTGDPDIPEQMAWVDHTQLDRLAARKAADEGQDLVTQAVENAIADDPVVQALAAAKDLIEAANDTSEVPEEFVRTVLSPAVEGVQATAEEAVEFTHDTQVILLIEAGAFDNLVWDTAQQGSQKIQVLF